MQDTEQAQPFQPEEHHVEQAKRLLEMCVKGDDPFERATNLVETVDSFFTMFTDTPFGEHVTKRNNHYVDACKADIGKKNERLLPVVLGRTLGMAVDFHVMQDVIKTTDTELGLIVGLYSRKIWAVMRWWHMIVNLGLTLDEEDVKRVEE